MYWYQEYPERWGQEQAIANKTLSNCESKINANQTAIIRGTFELCSEHGHTYEFVRLRIKYPTDFPSKNRPPSVYLESHRERWKNTGDSHIESDWRLCLFVPGESGIDFADPSSLNALFAVIQTFLLKQRIYQKRLAMVGKLAKWPGEDRSHGEKGIMEAIKAMGKIGRNSLCPCASGKKYKKCHLIKMNELTG